MTAPIPQPDRRRAHRALADFPIRFSEDPKAKPAIMRDISEIGLACASPREVPEMTVVGLDFSLPGGKEVHHVMGAVVRCERTSDDSFDVAVYFTEVGPKTRTALTSFVAAGRPAP